MRGLCVREAALHKVRSAAASRFSFFGEKRLTQDVHAIATEYADWLGTSNVPKLFLKADPGAILANDTLVNLVRGWPALTEKTVAGIHFVQEDSPDEIGRAIAGWMGNLQRSQQQHSIRRKAG